MFQAWQTARFYLLGKSKRGLQPLKKYMDEIGKMSGAGRQQSVSQVKSMLSVISEQYGIPLRKKKGRRG